jgi:hypothetical protein
VPGINGQIAQVLSAPPASFQQGQKSPAQGPQIPPQTAQYIRQLLASPQTRQQGFALYQQHIKPKDPSYGVIGKDELGKEIYGWIDPRSQTTTPNRQFDRPQQPSTLPPAPPGVDPKIWRDEQSKAAAANAVPGSPDFAMKMRREVQDLPSYKNIAQAAPVYKSMLNAAGRDTRAADVNLIYGLAKIMDPGSVVRESEMSVAQAVATLPQQLQATVMSQINSTGRLTPDVREAIMQEAHSRIGAYQTMFDQDAGMYRGIAGRQRVNPEDVIPSFGPFDQFKRAAPAGGAGPFGTPASGVLSSQPTAEDIDAELRRRGVR